LTLSLTLPCYAITSNGIDFPDTLKAGKTDMYSMARAFAPRPF